MHLKNLQRMKKKILVTLNEKQYEILKELDELGSTDSEKLRNVLVAYYNIKKVLEKEAK